MLGRVAKREGGMLGALGTALFVVVGVYLCAGSLLPGVFAEPPASPSKQIVVFVTGMADPLFFGFAFVFLVGRLTRFRRPILEVGPDDILDRASALSAGFVPWEGVEDVRVRGFLLQRFLGVRLRDERGFLARRSLPRRLLMGLNRTILGTPIAVPMSALAVREDVLLGEIERHLRRFARG